MQYAYAKYFTLPFNMPTYGREREYFLLFQNQKYFQTTVSNTKSKTSNTFQTDFSFLKAIRRGRFSFPHFTQGTAFLLQWQSGSGKKRLWTKGHKRWHCLWITRDRRCEQGTALRKRGKHGAEHFCERLRKWYEFPLQMVEFRASRYVKGLITWWW